MQKHSRSRRCIAITPLLCLLLPRCSLHVDCVRSDNLSCDGVRDHHVIEEVRSSRVENHEVHPLVTRRIDIVEDARHFNLDRLTAAPNHLS